MTTAAQVAPEDQAEFFLSSFIENYIHLKGDVFSFDGYEFFRPTYDSAARGKILKTGRQVSKSTAQANILIANCCLIPHFSALYVAPTENHISVFSKQKLNPTLKSPAIEQHFFGSGRTNQAFYKQFTNGSDLILRSCFLDPEAIRGISSDFIAIDEIQNILTDNIPVIEECYTRSEHKFRLYSGTPKTNQHAIEYYWDQSTKFEWLVKCLSCNHWNYLDESCVQVQGLSCAKCGKLINAQENGEWVSCDTSKKSRFEGYRVSQLMVPWIPWDLENALKMFGEDADENGTILYKWKKYTRSKFYNECLGLPYDDAACPITLLDMIEACDPSLKLHESCEDSSMAGRMVLFSGIDWSTSQESASYTVHTIGGYIPGDRFCIVYAKRYEGIESELNFMLDDIADTILKFGVKVVGADWGSGADKNKLLMDKLRNKRIQMIQFNHSGTQKAEVAWNQKAKMVIINRTQIMTEMFLRVKQKDTIFPNWIEMETFLLDLLNIFADYNEILKVIFYNRPANKPDDYMHALCFCHLAATIAEQA
jgi:hypothetical protein